MHILSSSYFIIKHKLDLSYITCLFYFLGYTFFNTVCTNSRKKYSIVELGQYNPARVVAHVLGHA